MYYTPFRKVRITSLVLLAERVIHQPTTHLAKSVGSCSEPNVLKAPQLEGAHAGLPDLKAIH